MQRFKDSSNGQYRQYLFFGKVRKMDPFQKEFLKRHNELRALHGVPSLSYDTQIAKSAQVKCFFFCFRIANDDDGKNINAHLFPPSTEMGRSSQTSRCVSSWSNGKLWTESFGIRDRYYRRQSGSILVRRKRILRL